MQNSDQNASGSGMLLFGSPQCEEEQLVVLELLVPEAAQVALPPFQPEIGSLTLREDSVTSTVPNKLYLQLQANNTALQAAWCTTATLTAPRQQHRRA